MHRLIWVPALALVACGTENDQRPRTVQYITEAVLAPSCGNAQCHSSFRNEMGYAFDTVEKAQLSLVGGLVGQITLNAKEEPEGDATSSLLVNALMGTGTLERMPYDQPLPEPDIALIERWIDYGAPGAQCNPAIDNGMICVGSKSVECQKSFDFGAVVKDCAAAGMICSAGVCR
jgi:hypothetical protein